MFLGATDSRNSSEGTKSTQQSKDRTPLSKGDETDNNVLQILYFIVSVLPGLKSA